MWFKGDIIEVCGLKSKPHWNEKQAIIIDHFNFQHGRYLIQFIDIPISDESKENEQPKALIKPCNIKLIKSSNIKSNAFKAENNINFSVSNTKEKEKGMFASKDMKAGTVIICSAPMIAIPRNMSNRNLSKEEYIVNKFNELCICDQQQILSLKNNVRKQNKAYEECVEIYFSNAFTIRNTLSEYESGMFVEIARVNHSCFPNCELFYDMRTHCRRMIAMFDISVGDELTVSYIPYQYSFGYSFQERQKYIYDNYDFVCKCEECALIALDVGNENKNDEQNEQRISREKWRPKYGVLYRKICGALEEQNAKKLSKLSQQMMYVLKNEFQSFPSLISQCFINLAKGALFSNVSDFERTLKFLKMSVSIDIRVFGDQCEFSDVEEMLQIIPEKLKTDFPWKHILYHSNHR